MANSENQVCEIQTFVFFDLETTGFAKDSRILELSMVAVSRGALLGMGRSFSPNPQAKSGPPSLPRVLHKFTHLYYPRKLITSFLEQLTGLNNDELHHLSRFSESSALAITSFLTLPTPVCLVAHNGNSFDFPILKAELMHVTSHDLDVLCVDSLLFARQFENNEIKLLTELAQHFNDEDFSDSESNSNNIELNNTTNHDLTNPVYETNGVSINGSNATGLFDHQNPVINDLKYQPSTSNDSLVIHLLLNHENLKTPNKKILTSPNTLVAPKKKNYHNDSFSTPNSQLSQHSQQDPNYLVSRSKAKRNLYPIKKKNVKKPFSQPTLYYRIFRCDYDAHRAESDALALLQICGYHGQDFVNWADSNYTQFKSVKPRWNSTRKSFML